MMRPEYIAIQAAIIRSFAQEHGFALPEVTDDRLVKWFQDGIKAATGEKNGDLCE